MQNYLEMETNPAINDSEKLHGIVYVHRKIKNELLEIKEEDLDDKEISNVEYLHTEKDTPLGMKTSPAISDEIVYEDWKLKNEELYIKEEDLEQKEISILSDCRSQDAPRQTFENDHPREMDPLLNLGNCSLNALQRDSLNEQHFNHRNTQDCKLNTCSKGFSKGQLLQRNLDRNPGDREKFQCDVCEYQTLYKKYLRVHMLRHKNPEDREKFECNGCRHQTFNKHNLKVHMLRHKNPEELKKFHCDECEYQTFDKHNLKKHMLRHKSPEQREKYKCDVCGHQTFYKSNLKQHMLRHRN